jgi:hypothetical protein
MNLRPNEERGKLAIVMVWIVLGCHMLYLISSAFQYELLTNIAGKGEFSMEEVDANDSRQQLIAIVLVVAYITSVITYIRWFRRAYYNLHSVTNYLTYTEGWAAGSWFVPIINLFWPYRIMKEMYERTQQLLNEKGHDIYPQLDYIGWWWALWIIINGFGCYSARYSGSAKEVDELMNSNIISMVGSLTYIPLCILAVVVIKNYMEMENIMHNLEDEAPVIETGNAEILPLSE